MMRVAIRGIGARKLRSLLTALAVALGVALVSGTLILTDTTEKAFGTILTTSYDRTDAVVTGRDVAGHGLREGVPAELLDRIRALPETGEASGLLVDLAGGGYPARVRDREGRRIDRGGPSFGFGIEPDAERFNPLDLVEGRWAARDGEVVVDAGTATAHGYAVGNPIDVSAAGGEGRFTVVGIARFGDVASIGGATVTVFDVRTAQRLHDKEGFETIAVAAADGVSPAALVASIRSVLPAGTEVRTGAQQAALDAKAGSFVEAVRLFLLAFGGLALLVGAFVIVNTLTITLAQRTRELATLRLLGASRRQVRRSVLLEGLVLGAAASLAGLAGGVAFAEGLAFAFGVLGLDLPEAERVLRARTAVVSLLVGIGVAFAATVLPAVRATRVPPLAAVRDAQTATAGGDSPRVSRPAVVLLAVGAVLLALGAVGSAPTGSRIALVLGGILAAFAGVGLVAPRLTRPLAALLGRPLALFGGAAGRIGHGNAVRDPTRTASTAAALAIGLTLVTFAVVVGHSIMSASTRAMREQVRADFVVEAPNGRDGASPDVTAALTTAPGIEAVTAVGTIRGGATLPSGQMVGVSGVEPATFTDLYELRWVTGSRTTMSRLGRDGAVVDALLAREQGLEVGDALVLRTREGDAIETVVRGVFASPRTDSLIGQVVVAKALVDASFPAGIPVLTLVRAGDRADVEAAVADAPDADVMTPSELAQARNRELTAVLRLLYVLLALSVVVSLFGMVNTLVLAVFERTREIGVLRAVGMTRRQVRRMVRHEGILTGLLGAGFGLPLGLGAAAAVIAAAGAEDFAFAVPAVPLAALAGVALIAGFVASVLPARQAARLDVLDALKYE